METDVNPSIANFHFPICDDNIRIALLSAKIFSSSITTHPHPRQCSRSLMKHTSCRAIWNVPQSIVSIVGSRRMFQVLTSGWNMFNGCINCSSPFRVNLFVAGCGLSWEPTHRWGFNLMKHEFKCVPLLRRWTRDGWNKRISAGRYKNIFTHQQQQGGDDKETTLRRTPAMDGEETPRLLLLQRKCKHKGATACLCSLLSSLKLTTRFLLPRASPVSSWISRGEESPLNRKEICSQP